MKLRLRSQKVVQDSSVVAESEIYGGLRQSCWANMPSELLREVFMKIESESKWHSREDAAQRPSRKDVVQCAGVCRSWREVMQEVVKSPQVSGKITFPISVKQPGPRDSLLQCFIKRNQSAQTYELYLSLSQALASDGKFLLAARRYRRPTCTDYLISLKRDDMSKGSRTYVGKLRSNFLGTKFVVYDSLPGVAGNKIARSCSTRLGGSKQVPPRVPAGSFPVAHISYDLNVLGARGPRTMHCVMDAIPASAIKPGGVAPSQISFPSDVDYFPYFESKSSCFDKSLFGPLDGSCPREGSLVLRNKAPRWHDQLKCWCLNFHGRVTVASVKNFQLVASPEHGLHGPEHDNVILQFGKVEKDVFTMDYRYPMSAFQAFAVCLSSFDTKIACE